MKKIKVTGIVLALLLSLNTLLGVTTFAEPVDEADTSAADSDTSADGEGTVDGTTEGDTSAPATVPGTGTPIIPNDEGTLLVPKQDEETEEWNEDYGLVNMMKLASKSEADVSVYSLQVDGAFAIEKFEDFICIAIPKDSSEAVVLVPTNAEDEDAKYAEYEVSAPTTVYRVQVARATDVDFSQLTEQEIREWKLENRGKFTTPEQRIKYMEELVTRGGTTMYVDRDLAEIALYNQAEDTYYFSSPYDYNRGMGTDELKALMGSMVQMTYFDSSNNEKSVNAMNDAVKKEDQLSTTDIENGIAFNYKMGTIDKEKLMPYASEVNTFETKVLNVLEDKLAKSKAAGDTTNEAIYSKALRKLKAFYRKYTIDKLSSSTAASMLSAYPGLKDHELYVLRQDTSSKQKEEMTSYIALTDYTWDDLALDNEISGYVPDDAAVACFEFKLELTLDENGDLIVNLPASSIQYDTENFTLYRVRLMQYFAAGRHTNDGYIFVPDGSGTLINFNKDETKTILSTICNVYGDDYALITRTEFLNLSRSTYIPVFGIKEKDNAMMAIIEEGDAMARIISESGGIQTNYEAVYSDFIYRTVQTVTYNDTNKANGSWTYLNKNSYQGNYRIRFKMLSGDDANYVGMANAYRTYLIENGVLTDKLSTNGSDMPFYLETLGLIDKEVSFYGIVYNKKIPLTTFEDAQSMLQELNDNGVSNISLRYRGWMNGGLNYSVPSKLKVESKLGGKSGLQELADFVKKGNMTLFPDVDFSVVRRDNFFDGYTTFSDAPRTTSKETLLLTPANEIHNILEITDNYFAISPKSSTKYYSKFFSKYKDLGIGSVSLGTAGSMLYSDFSQSGNGVHRQEAMNILKKNLSDNADSIGRLMVEGGNAYTYQYASDIIDIPLSDSGYYLEDESIPFLQIVLHGYKQYAGEALNMADNMEDCILKSAEYGANLHMTLSMQNTGELKDTVYSRYYTLDFSIWKGDAIEQYKKFNAIFTPLQDQLIVKHEKVSAGVYMTTYENGTQVVVNYNNSEAKVKDKTIPQRSFAVL